MLSSRRHDPFKTQPKGKNIPIEGKLDCLSGKRFGLAVKERSGCEGPPVARTPWATCVPWFEGSAPRIRRVFSRCIGHDSFDRLDLTASHE
jgi:hypothetical protein